MYGQESKYHLVSCCSSLVLLSFLLNEIIASHYNVNVLYRRVKVTLAQFQIQPQLCENRAIVHRVIFARGNCVARIRMNI